MIEKIDIEQIGGEDEKGAYISDKDALINTGEFLKYNSDFGNHKVLILHNPESKK